MDEIVLKAEKRAPGSKGAVHSLRRQGRVPGVAYGDNEAPMALSLDERALQGVLKSERGRNALIRLEIDNGSHPVLVKELQRHPITRALWHVDFHRVSLKKKIEAAVPLHTKGEAPGVKLGGGILEHVLREVRVRCLPADIPAALDVDVSALQVGQSLKAKDIPAPKGVELLGDPEAVIVNVVAPTILEEAPAAAAPEAAAGATAAEPEVIKKGKTEEGEEGAAPAAKPAAAKPEAAKKPEGK